MLLHTNLLCQAIGLVQNIAQVQTLDVFMTIGRVQKKSSVQIGLVQTSALLQQLLLICVFI